MSDIKNVEEQKLVDTLLKAPIAIKDSSDKEVKGIMKYGIDKINLKTIEEFEEDFINQLEQKYDFLDGRFISKVLKKIKVEKDELWFYYY